MSSNYLSPQPGTIDGRIMIDKRPIPGVKVYVIDTVAQIPVRVVVTDSTGRYRATGLSANVRYHTVPLFGSNGSWFSAPANAAVFVSPPPAGVASVTVSPSTPSLLIGQTVQLTAVARDNDGNEMDEAVTWSSLTPLTASVSSSGLVTGLAAGVVIIRATVQSIHGTAQVTVTAIPVPTRIEVSPSSIALTVSTVPVPTRIAVSPSSIALTLTSDPPEDPVPTRIEVAPSSITLVLEDEEPPEDPIPTRIEVDPTSITLALE